MSPQLSSNKTIAKNTSFLYLRMIIILIVSLYTSRVVLQQLGIDDFGLYNAVGSLVLLFSYIQGSLASSSSRFLSYEIGGGTPKSLNSTFCTLLNIHIIFAIVILILSETVGLWYVCNKMVIPDGRYNAVLVVYQLSNICALLGFLIIPYRALIISEEHMGAFAYVSIFEVLSKLGIALLLEYTSSDKLVIYSFLLCLMQLLTNALYFIYCKQKFTASRYYLQWDSNRIKSIFSYSGWTLLSYSQVLVHQAFNLLINLFFGASVNAARAISYQVQTNVYNFVQNFQTALNPQIVKNHAANNGERVNFLVNMSSKISFSLLMIILLPLLCNINFVLRIWLTEVPEYSDIFIILICVSSVFSATANPYGVVVEAANGVKRQSLILTPYYLLLIPLCYFLLKQGAGATIIFVMYGSFEMAAFFIKLKIATHYSSLSGGTQIKLFSLYLQTIIVAIIFGYCINMLFNETFGNFVIKCIASFLFISFWLYIVILNKSEKNLLINYVKNRLPFLKTDINPNSL